MNKRKKIAFVIPSLRGGGAERVITNLVNKINQDKFDIKLIVLNLHDSIFQKEINENIEIIDLGTKRVRSSMFKILAAIKKNRPDIVFSTLGYLNLYLAIIKPFFPKETVLISRETNVVSEKLKVMRFKFFWIVLYKLLRNRFDCIVCQSNDMKNDLVEKFNYQNLVVINNPIDLDALRKKIKRGYKNNSPKSYVHFIAVGRLQYQKGFDILIDAIYLLKNSNIQLSILGKGPLEFELQSQIDKLNLANQIQLVGFQENPYQWMSECDAFVLSSRFEGFPNVVLESLALDTPVIAIPAKGGVKEILEPIDGCVIAKGMSPKELAQAIQKFLNLKKKKFIPSVEKYEISNIVDEYERLFITLTNRL